MRGKTRNRKRKRCHGLKKRKANNSDIVGQRRRKGRKRLVVELHSK